MRQQKIGHKRIFDLHTARAFVRQVTESGDPAEIQLDRLIDIQTEESKRLSRGSKRYLEASIDDLRREVSRQKMAK